MGRIFLVHFADLHVGSGFDGDFVSSGTLRSGFNGHDRTVCRAFANAVRRVRLHDFAFTSDDVVQYVCGGDFTRTGSDNDFWLAYGLLLDAWRLPDLVRPERIGLGIPVADLHSVAGNHDHWLGQTSLSPNPYTGAVYPRFFRDSPWRSGPIYDAKQTAKRTMAVELFGIDSNRGLAMASSNLRAAGSLHYTDLNTLQQHLADSQADETKDGVPYVRAIVCHHAFTANHFWSAQPLDDPSRKSLLDLAWKFGVVAVLTGHTHEFVENPYTNPKNSAEKAWELRCASTTQMNPQPEPQGFYVHAIERPTGGAAPTWTAHRYALDASQASFVPTVTKVIR